MEKLSYSLFEKNENYKINSLNLDINLKDILMIYAYLLPIDINPKVVIDLITNNFGILSYKTKEYLCFPHKTFLEYFCSSYIVKQNNFSELIYRKISENREWWREVFIFLIGKIRNNKDSLICILSTFLYNLEYKDTSEINENNSEIIILLNLALLESDIYIMYQNDSSILQKFLKRLHDYLYIIIENEEINNQTRNKAGAILGKIGDFRKGVNIKFINSNYSPDIDWIFIPKGNFIMGSEETSSDYFKIESPQVSLYLDTFKISKYPITNSQYKLFIDSNGYNNPRWWSINGWNWLNNIDRTSQLLLDNNILVTHIKEKIKERQLANLKNTPAFWYHEPYNISNYPVVGLNWYEAEAYCNWLSKFFNSNEKIKLPTEAQWEKAVRGSSSLNFPWGNKWIEDCANCIESKFAATCTVGLFPKGKSRAYGLYDCAGNIWEWTSTTWGGFNNSPDFKYPYSKFDGRENQNIIDTKVIRGGSFQDIKESCRCTSRSREYIESYGVDLGFRPILIKESK